ncbi:GATA transcription factor 1 [Salvia miltiorrhiza]|uniref:GATA transcription factor 1 n=1 Tax=Salvia miltiorrhiza TaxID=226208 RepID=UPI0025AD05E9|nr:GATA transcription factor 1 [Salvia miltiorrhiza]
MEILDAAEACFMVGDDLLDFTLDGEAEEDYDHKISYSSSSSSLKAAAESLRGSFPEFAEEELEWLSNKDEFPAVETCFGILSDNPELLVSHHSPSSVLENSSSSGDVSGGGSASASCCGSLKVPVRPRSNGRRRRRRVDYGELPPDQAMWSGQVTWMLPRISAAGGGGRMGRRCLHCQSDKTPQWRAGPMGPKTLCNACGVRYKSGRLLPEYRPANSPTFSSKLHSNSHRRVVEMRRQTLLG